MRKRILLADDEPFFAALSREILTKLDFDVIVTRGGEEAVRAARTHQPDAVILDHYMPPGMTGLETLKAFKADPELQPIPVLIWSGTNDCRLTVADAKGAGAVGFVKKPLFVQEFLSRVMMVLSQS